MKYQKEWDIASYQRKFSGTLAWTKIGDGPWQWKYIAGIKESQLVYFAGNANSVGQVCLECNCGPNEAVPHNMEKLPVIQFGYRPIYPGAYFDKNGKDLWFLRKKHLKSYKVGLSEETFYIRNSKDYWRVSDHIDLDRPVFTYTRAGEIEVFDKKLVRAGYDLFADGVPIGFLDKGVAVLRSPKLIPWVRKQLEEKWQIASL